MERMSSNSILIKGKYCTLLKHITFLSMFIPSLVPASNLYITNQTTSELEITAEPEGDGNTKSNPSTYVLGPSSNMTIAVSPSTSKMFSLTGQAPLTSSTCSGLFTSKDYQIVFNESKTLKRVKCNKTSIPQ